MAAEAFKDQTHTRGQLTDLIPQVTELRRPPTHRLSFISDAQPAGLGSQLSLQPGAAPPRHQAWSETRGFTENAAWAVSPEHCSAFLKMMPKAGTSSIFLQPLACPLCQGSLLSFRFDLTLCTSFMPRGTEQAAPPSRKYGALSLFLHARCWSYWNISYHLVTWISSACISLSQGQHLLPPHLFPARDTLPLEHCTHKHQVQSLKGAATCQLTRKLATRSTAQCAPSPKIHIHLLQAMLEQQIYVCWKGFTLGSRGDGKGRRMDLKRLYRAASGERQALEETKHKPKQ